MSKAVVLLSGGLDSTTTLAIAKSQKFDCYALSFDYGQKQRSELVSAKSIAKQFNVIEQRQSLGVDYSQTISCYQANNKDKACGECDACVLRQNGFTQAGVADLTNYR